MQNNSTDIFFDEQRDLCTDYLLKQGYKSDKINDAFTKLSGISKRTDLYSDLVKNLVTKMRVRDVSLL